MPKGQRLWLVADHKGQPVNAAWAVFRSRGISIGLPFEGFDLHLTYHSNGYFHTARVSRRDKDGKMKEVEGTEMSHLSGMPFANFHGVQPLNSYSIDLDSALPMISVWRSPGDVDVKMDKVNSLKSRIPTFIFLTEGLKPIRSKLLNDPDLAGFPHLTLMCNDPGLPWLLLVFKVK